MPEEKKPNAWDDIIEGLKALNAGLDQTLVIMQQNQAAQEKLTQAHLKLRDTAREAANIVCGGHIKRICDRAVRTAREVGYRIASASVQVADAPKAIEALSGIEDLHASLRKDLDELVRWYPEQQAAADGIRASIQAAEEGIGKTLAQLDPTLTIENEWLALIAKDRPTSDPRPN